MTDSTAVAAPPTVLAIKPEQYVAEVFAPFKARLAAAQAADAALTYDPRTPAGLKLATAQRGLLRSIRTEAENQRRTFKGPLLDAGRQLDAAYKLIEAAVEPLEDRHDSAIKAVEAEKEAERLAKVKAEQEWIAGMLAKVADIGKWADRCAGLESSVIAGVIDKVAALEITLEDYAEFAGNAAIAKRDTLARLETMKSAAVAQEAIAERQRLDRIELDKLRAEAQERDRLAAEQRKKDEEQARLDREAEQARQRAEREKEQARLKAERDQLEADQAAFRKQKAEAAAKLKEEQDARDAAALAEQQERERVAAEKQAEIDQQRKAEEQERQRVADAEAEERRLAEQESIAADTRLRNAAPLLLSALTQLRDDLMALVGESDGVKGLHQNGDISPWDDLMPGGHFERFDGLRLADEAIAAASPLSAEPE